MDVVNCSFCGKTNKNVEKMISGPDGVCICNECIDMTQNIISNQRLKEANKSVAENNGFNKLKLTPVQIMEILNKSIIDQESAKKTLSVAVYNHYKRLEKISKGVKITKSNVLLVGPTGSGKTLIAETLAELMDVPIAIADATTLTEAGYVGEDVEIIIRKLLQKCDWDPSKAENGIIYIDEIDKLTKGSENPSTSKDVGGEGVQQALLKLIEGTVVSVPTSGDGRKVPGKGTVDVNTKNILFICGGAFSGIEKIINEEENVGGIGFKQGLKDSGKDIDVSAAMKKVTPDILRKFGLIPELAGRLPIIASLHELDIDAMIRILTEPENSIVNGFVEIMDCYGVELVFEKDALQEIAEDAFKRKVGARGLRSIVELTLENTLFLAPSEEGLLKVTITKDTVKSKGLGIFEYVKAA